MKALKTLLVLLVLLAFAGTALPPASAQGLPPCAEWSLKGIEGVTSQSENNNLTVRPYSSFTLDVNITNLQPGPANFTIDSYSGIVGGGKQASIEYLGLPGMQDVHYTGYLDPGEQVHFQVNVTIPAGFPPDTYPLTLIAHTPNYQFYENTTLQLNITVATAALPIVSSIQPSNLTMRLTETANLTITVTNLGNRGTTVELEPMREGEQGSPVQGLPFGWGWIGPGEIIVPPDSQNTTQVTITVSNTSTAGEKTFYVGLLDTDGSPLTTFPPTPFTVYIEPIPYIEVENISVESPYKQALTGVEVNIQVSLFNPSGIPGDNITLILYDGTASPSNEIGRANLSLPAGTRRSAVFNTTFTSTGRHHLTAVVQTPDGSIILAQKEQVARVAANPLLYILIGFICLTGLMGVVVGLIVYERYRFPAQISLSAIKEERESQDIKPSPEELADLNLDGSLPVIPTTPPREENGEGENEAKAQAVDSGKKVRRRRARVRPKEPAPRYAPPKKETAPPTPVEPAPLISEERDTGPGDMEKAEELRERLKEVKAQVHEARLKGVDTSSLEKLLSEAGTCLASREYGRAEVYLNNVSQRTQDLLEKREKAREAIRDAQTLIYGMRYTDVDLSQPKNFVTRAENAFKRGDFTEAIKQAERAIKHAEQLERINGSRAGETGTGGGGGGPAEEEDDIRL
ncbi:MAG: hypothetical protein J7L61_00535 [Thermoplasmata archaeon]|nr:hypothetical protein [Thermoplasmata archaeon]